ncbi:tyrosine-type recombinase/integrase [Sulfurimonas microaerophilic]|uniref:tyrosine-type recombinase/integrase n=1 Tax=Sulfurimonas microaerophilic TaxID=3058392 RepID=UPI002714884E|nr:site-specific integrase [Sulfurimonas sp. hsl 1-7]
MQDIKASILSRGNRKFWYVKYQVLFENDDVKVGQESTKVLKTEKTLKYMQTKYLPVWIAKKMEELKAKKQESKKFSYYFKKFLELHKTDKSYHTRIGIYNKVNRYFGDMNVAKIKPLTVKEYLASLNLRNGTKRDYLGCIKGTLDIALDDDAIERNVAFGIRFKREEKAPIEPFSVQEVNLMLENSTGMFRNYLGVALHTGMRSGEILGLMHSDILEDRITIRRSVSKGRVTSPKTLGSVRDIPLFDAVKPYIESQRKLSKSLYLFEFDGSFIKDATFFKRRWHQLVKDCGMNYRKLYTTRHTFITAMLNSEQFKIMEIAAIVGHTSPEMIMKNYAGFIRNEHLKVATNIELFKKAGDTLGDTSTIRHLNRA